jgi:hypothetical protein
MIAVVVLLTSCLVQMKVWRAVGIGSAHVNLLTYTVRR